MKKKKTSAKQRLWSAGGELDAQIEDFTVGNDRALDQKLVKYDCLASIAHARMLKKIGLLDDGECSALVAALRKIMAFDAAGKFAVSADDEDCHTAIENFLVAELGDVGKKIHAARSRNDQVLTALRLYYADEVTDVFKLSDCLSRAFAEFKRKHGKTLLPGYTHTRKAMPSTAGAWAQSFVDALRDDETLLRAAAELANQSPLGSGAGYGLPVAVDREFTARLLGFSKVQENAIYVQNSRGKFEASLVHALTQFTFDLNKFASDAILFSMPELGFFELPKAFCTGSSIMPHKRNPDVLELLRAKHGVVVACEFEVKTVTANLPSGYNRDLQLTKEPVFKAFEVAKDCLRVAERVVSKMTVNEERCKAAMTAELYSAERALALAAQGVPFRDAYREVSRDFD